MANTHYKLPLNFGRLFPTDDNHTGQLEHCTELESIDNHLGLLLVTHCGEHSFNLQYGTRLWDLDFENITSRSTWDEIFKDYILQAIALNEKRLKDVRVEIDVMDTAREDMVTLGYSVRKQVDIIIHGTVVSTGKPCVFKHIIYLGPLTRD
jgi:phage baseplate assembly protein W